MKELDTKYRIYLPFNKLIGGIGDNGNTKGISSISA